MNYFLKKIRDIFQKTIQKILDEFPDWKSLSVGDEERRSIYIDHNQHKELGFLMDSRFYGRQDYIAELDHLLENTTLDQVNDAIRKHFQTQNMNVVIVTDDSEAKPLAESLKKNKTSKMSYANQLKAELPQHVLEEDAAVESYPLNIENFTQCINEGGKFTQIDMFGNTETVTKEELKQFIDEYYQY